MNTFFVGLESLLRWKRHHRDQLPMGLTAMVTPDTRIEASLVMMPVPVSSSGRRQKLAQRPVRDQHLGYKAYLLFGVTQASVPAERSWARDAMCTFFR